MYLIFTCLHLFNIIYSIQGKIFWIKQISIVKICLMLNYFIVLIKLEFELIDFKMLFKIGLYLLQFRWKIMLDKSNKLRNLYFCSCSSFLTTFTNFCFSLCYSLLYFILLQVYLLSIMFRYAKYRYFSFSSILLLYSSIILIQLSLYYLLYCFVYVINFFTN